MQLGPYKANNNLVLAPMAGITDRPYRQLCKELGAGLAVSEMVSSNSLLWGSEKTRRRADQSGEAEPRIVQIVGADPALMATAARYNVDRGAQIIDINMGCPARKICNVMAGSALLRDEPLVARILEAVVKAVEVPVTLKIRTGWNKDYRNAVVISQLAEKAGIQAITVHGRTRACGFKNECDYDTIAAVKASISIPVIANGDIDSPEKARYVSDYTKADGLMIGRAAQGRPWIFYTIAEYLKSGTAAAEPTVVEKCSVLTRHLESLYDFYGEASGVRIARKHIAWYSRGQRCSATFRQSINRTEEPHEQIDMVHAFFANTADCLERAA